jgi:thymidylate kinase
MATIGPHPWVIPEGFFDNDEEPMKPRLVLFEGPDKVGKSTNFKAFREATNYGPLAIDRFTGSNYVYDKIYNRHVSLASYLEMEDYMQNVFDVYLVLLTVDDPDIWRARIVAGEPVNELERTLKNCLAARAGFKEYFDHITHYKKKLILDTSHSSLRDNTVEILKFVGL